jgi:methylenetetrahydrofolate reductase (NADPH)
VGVEIAGPHVGYFNDGSMIDTFPVHVTMTVTVSPRKGLAATLETTEALRAHGYAVVPHISARLVASEREVKRIADRLGDAGVRDIFVVGGDIAEPVGPFSDALGLLETLDVVGHPFEEIGIAGYPESHPLIDDDILVQAMWDKRRYATYIVSQVCFTASPIIGWVQRIRRRGIELPVYVGIPGVADKRKLLRIARRIGVTESGRFLLRHKNWAWRLTLPGAYRPKRLLEEIAPMLADPERGVAGFHVYTFNELAQTEAWRQRAIAGLHPDIESEETR